MTKHALLGRAPTCLMLILASSLAGCYTVRDWRELQTEPMTLGACYDGVEFIASNSGFRIDSSKSDRGLGTWQSRWRKREKERHFPIRNRLKLEILVDEGSTATGWPVRYLIEQEKVVDLRRHANPQEDDWSSDGQDSEGESILGQRLVRRLAPKSVETGGAPPAR